MYIQYFLLVIMTDTHILYTPKYNTHQIHCWLLFFGTAIAMAIMTTINITNAIPPTMHAMTIFNFREHLCIKDTQTTFIYYQFKHRERMTWPKPSGTRKLLLLLSTVSPSMQQ